MEHDSPVDVEGEFAQLGPTGYRQLRVRDSLFYWPLGAGPVPLGRGGRQR